MSVERGVMKRAESDAVRDNRRAQRLAVANDVRSLQE